MIKLKYLLALFLCIVLIGAIAVGCASKKADSKAATASSSSISSAESSSLDSSSSSAAASSSSSTSASTSSTQVTAPAAAVKQNANANTHPTTTTPSRQISTKPSSNNSSNNPLYTPIPTSQELKYKTVSGNSLRLNVNAFTLEANVNDSNVQNYPCDEIYAVVTNTTTGKDVFNGVCGGVDDSCNILVCPPLDTYEHNGKWWLSPATYSVHVYCQKGQYSMNTTAGRPNKVDICTFSFSVYERGFR